MDEGLWGCRSLPAAAVVASASAISVNCHLLLGTLLLLIVGWLCVLAAVIVVAAD